MQQECRDMAQALAMGSSACRMPPPPARAPPAHKDAHGAEPHGRSLIAMHVAAAPHTPSAVVLFGVDASRTSTCITLPVRTTAPIISLPLFPLFFPFRLHH
ncbi:hypothetical protein [Pandoravirus japonicus]|uniref:Uncharacterized protein n=1 Tax=Pandoravirus japonicus TaxID=2823154 RepID=A0A811BQD4_9VIRU|nr:hypothetical protein [Pandoravirus japonicus]